MKRKFITNLALLLFLNLLVKPFWIFGIDRTVQNTVGESEYGLYFSLFQLSILLNVILDLGIRNFNNRDIAQHNQLLSKYLSNIFGLKTLLAIFYFVLCIVVSFVVGYDQRQFKLFMILAFNQFVSVFILYLRSNISALHYFKTDSIISVLDRFLMIVFCIVLLWGNLVDISFSVEVFAYVQTFAYLLTFVIAFVFVLSKSEFFRFQIERNYIIALLKKSFPFALLTLLMGSYTYMDAVLLERMLPDGKFQAGVYAQAFRIFNAFWMFGLLYAGLLLPMFAKMIKHKEPVGELVQFSFLLLVVPASLLVISCVFYKNEIIGLLYHGHSTESPTIFGILVIGFIGTCISIIFGTLLTANGSLKQLNTMAFVGMVVNIVLNLVLIPKYKALGSAVAALATQGITGLIQMVFAIKVFQFKIPWKLLVLYMVFFAGTGGLGYLSRQLEINWLYEFAAMLAVSFLFAILIKLVNLKVLYQIIKFGDER